MKFPWPLMKLDDLLQLIIDHRGITPKKLDGDWVENGIPVLSAMNINSGKITKKEILRYVTKTMYEKWMPKKLEEGDVLLTSEAPLGQTFLIKDSEYCIGQRLFALRANPTILDPQFLYYLLNSEHGQTQLISRASGSTVKGIRQAELLQIKLPVPELISEQQKICEILNNLDLLIEQKNKIIKNNENLKKGLLQKLYTTGTNNSKTEKVKLSNLSQTTDIEIPLDWEIKKIEEIAVINPQQITKDYDNDNIDYIDIGSIENFRIQKYENFSINDRPSRAQRIVQKNDILISTVRPYLQAFTKINNDKSNLICSTGFTVLRPKNTIDANFLFFYSQSYSFNTNLIRMMEGMAYPAITSTVLSNTRIPYPKKDKEREKIGEILFDIDSKIELLRKRKSNLTDLKKGLMQKLLTGEIRVKV